MTALAHRTGQKYFRNGFTLLELLIVMLLTVTIGGTTCSIIYYLKLSHEQSSRIQMAREKAQRVVSFIEPRVINCGLGLWACSTRQKIQLALGSGDQQYKSSIADWEKQSIPIRVYERSSPGSNTWNDLDEPTWNHGSPVFRGEGLSVLYAKPTGVFLSSAHQTLSMFPGVKKSFDVILGTDNSGASAESIEKAFSGNIPEPNNGDVFFNWCALPAIGLPAYIARFASKIIDLRLARFTALPDGEVGIPQVMEIYRLWMQRFVVNGTTFRVQEFKTRWPSDGTPREDDILTTWYELWLKEKRLDIWVLAKGGAAVFGRSARPMDWPSDAPWDDDFTKYELYVARASYRLDNLRCDDFLTDIVNEPEKKLE